MSDQKPEDDITLDKADTEEDLFASLQDDFDTLLATRTNDSTDHLEAFGDEQELPLDEYELPLNEQELPLDEPPHSGMQDDFDAFENETLGTENSTERESMEAEFSADISSAAMTDMAKESIPVAAPPPRPSSTTKWIPLLSIAFGLASISLAFWLKVVPIESETEIAKNSSPNMTTTLPPAPTQRPKATTDIDQQQPEHEKTVVAAARKPVIVSSAEDAPKLVSKPITPATNISDANNTVALTKNSAETNTTVAKKVISKPAGAASKTTKGSGNWAVVLSSVNSEKTALQQQARMRVGGVNTEYVQNLENGRVSYHIQVSGFSNRQEAEKQIAILTKKLGMRGAWVNKL